MLISFILGNLNLIYTVIISLLTYYLYNRNKTLKKENFENKKVIQTQKEIIHVIKNNKPVSISDNIKRMRNKEL